MRLAWPTRRRVEAGWSPCVAVNTRTKLENAVTFWPVAVTARHWTRRVIGGYSLFKGGAHSGCQVLDEICDR